MSSQQQVADDTIASQVHSIGQRVNADGLAIEQEMRFIDDGYSGSTLVRPALERLRDMADAGAIDRLYVPSPDRLARNYAYQVVLVVRQMFAWIGTAHVSLREVRRRLEKQGVLSPTGKDHWGRGTIWNILNNPVYMGQAAYGRRRTGEPRKRLRPCRHASGQPRRPRGQYAVPSEQWIRFAVPAIVDADLFQAVAEQLKENRRRCRARMTNTPALLGGLTVCARCGYSLCAMKHKSKTTDRISYNYYRCIGRNSHRNGGQAVCDNKAVNAAQLDSAVWRDVCDLLDDPARVEEEYSRRLQGPGDQSLAGEKQKLIDAASKTRRAITRLLDAWTDGLIEKAEFESRTRSARTRLEQLEAQIKSQSQLETGQAELRLIIGSLGAFADKIKQGLSTADQTVKRDIIKALVKRVEVNQEEIRIIYRINPNQPDRNSNRPFLQHCPADA